MATDDFTPAESAADEIRLRIGALDRKITTALRQAEHDEQSAHMERENARRMAQIRDEYQAMLDASEGPHPLTATLHALRQSASDPDDIRRRRHALDMPQKALAERAGVSRDSVARLERGDAVTSREVVERVVRALTSIEREVGER